ncbi:MAG: hypothetical protein MRZ79_17175 [Bacteroidia bacterium]|nr:hypothetical protein [Bacteroidia bacterium]
MPLEILLDFVDGQLSDAEVEVILEYLRDNPDELYVLEGALAFYEMDDGGRLGLEKFIEKESQDYDFIFEEAPVVVPFWQVLSKKLWEFFNGLNQPIWGTFALCGLVMIVLCSPAFQGQFRQAASSTIQITNRGQGDIYKMDNGARTFEYLARSRNVFDFQMIERASFSQSPVIDQYPMNSYKPNLSFVGNVLAYKGISCRINKVKSDSERDLLYMDKTNTKLVLKPKKQGIMSSKNKLKTKYEGKYTKDTIVIPKMEDDLSNENIHKWLTISKGEREKGSNSKMISIESRRSLKYYLALASKPYCFPVNDSILLENKMESHMGKDSSRTAWTNSFVSVEQKAKDNQMIFQFAISPPRYPTGGLAWTAYQGQNAKSIHFYSGQKGEPVKIKNVALPDLKLHKLAKAHEGRSGPIMNASP